MKRKDRLPWLVLIAALAAPGCPCGKQEVERPYPKPSVEQLLSQVRKNGEEVSSYVAESTMDYWVGDQRIKSTVYVMGERGAKIRLNAINPATDTRATDLGCDGVGFAYVDYENNCQLSGVCDKDSIAQLLRVRLEPDDFLLLVVGSTPIVAEPTGTLSWDSKRGAEVLDLVEKGGSRRQRLVLSGKQGQWDVIESVVTDAKGAVEWKLENKSFKTIETEDGKSLRVPEYSHFEQPADKADLIARWDRRTLNLELDPSKFQVDLPPVVRCGRKNGASPAASELPPASELPVNSGQPVTDETVNPGQPGTDETVNPGQPGTDKP